MNTPKPVPTETAGTPGAAPIRPARQGWPELLAPAGDFERLRAAVAFGADAVYLSGRQYSLRSGPAGSPGSPGLAANFAADELPEAIAYAHAHGVRVYAALNILAHPGDFAGLPEAIRGLQAAGADAVIVSDPGVLALVREEAPGLAIHVSTQASVTNARACRFYHEQGASRIILARELSLEEIRQIRAEIPPELELECFVHGAVCLSYSGRCLLSNHLLGRDANRGQCAQPCRWTWQMTAANHPENPLLIEEDERGSYLLNARDLCMVEHLPALAAAGVSSFKIEGRRKSAYYVATVTGVYRRAIDAWLADPGRTAPDPAWRTELAATVNRDFDTGFYFPRTEDDAAVLSAGSDVRTATVVGVVRAWRAEAGLMLVEQRNHVRRGDCLELVRPRRTAQAYTVERMLDLDGAEIDRAPHPQMYFYLPCPEPVEPGSFLRRP